MGIELLLVLQSVGVLFGTCLGGCAGLALGAFLTTRGWW